MNLSNQIISDFSNKSVLARACDPSGSLYFAKVVPPRIGNAQYVPSTDDVDFIKKLESQEWSVIFFAPGACRYNATKKEIPGGNLNTKGWTLEQYKSLVRKLQGSEIQIVETLDERETVSLLNEALRNARNTKKK